MKQLLFLLTALLTTALLHGQTGSISGRITDSAYKKPYSLATVTVFKAADTTIVTYRLSTESGEFRVPGLPLNTPLRFIVSYSGHTNYRKEFMLTENTAQLRFDSIVLRPVGTELEEVLVIAERPPVIIKKDTIEFNASAFRTLPNALLEDLLKKLPGVQVDADGNIMVNGKAVNRILVDGKSFFGDDPKMATRNLPSNVIDKVQVSDDKEQEMITGTLNPNDIGKVINITLKKGVKKGWFGKLYAGAGTSDLYDAGAIANIYRDTLQLSILGYLNNMNKASFNNQDLLQTGGLSRNQSTGANGSIGISSSGVGNAVSINGINFGGSQGNSGIATSKGAGLNLNHTPNTRRTFFLQYFFGNSIVDRKVDTDVKQYFNDTFVTNLTRLRAKVNTNTHNIGGGMRLKPDSVTTIIMNANYTIGLSNEGRQSMVNTLNNKLGDLSASRIFQNNESASHAYRHTLNYVKLSRTKKGRRLSFTNTLDINKRNSDYLTESETNIYYPGSATSFISQLRRDSIPRIDARAYAIYSEPISSKFSLRVNSQYEYGQNRNEVSTYGKSVTNRYDSLYPGYSSNLKRQTHRLVNSFAVDYRYKNLTISPTVRSIWQTSQVQTPYLPAAFRQSQHNFAPALSIVYKQLNIGYDQGIVLPGYNYLIATTDNSNPYYITRPNPNLLPSRRDNVYVNYYFNNVKKNLTAFFTGQVLFTKNDIVDNISVDNTGVQTTTPVNANGSRRFFLNYSFSKQYKYNQKFTLATNMGGFHSYTRNRLMFNSISSWQNTFVIQKWTGLNLNWNDKFEWNNTYSIGYSFTRYTSKQFTNLKLVNHDVSTELVLRYPKHLIWETKLTYTKYANSTPGFPAKVFRWNAGVSVTMLKDERGVLNLRVYDILDQNNYVSTSVTRNMTSITNSNVLPQYFMATFTYNVRALNNAPQRKVGGGLFNF
jgi:hypothetical protein